MKTSIEHLPENKRNELDQLASIIRQHTHDIAMIILFGSYARGEYKEEKDLLPKQKSGHASDYDILVISSNRETAENSSLWKKINDQFHSQPFSAVPRLIVHDIQEININLAQAHYFYTEIVEEGCFLYNSERFTLAEKRDLLPNERKRLAQEHYDSCFNSAVDFYEGYEFYLSKAKYTKAAFSLNQATESAYKTILLVFTNYAPHEHYLSLLGNAVADENKAFADIFPRKTDNDNHRFNLLDYAYIGARYDPKFKIDKEDLELLANSVKKLLDLTQQVCKEKIQSMV